MLFKPDEFENAALRFSVAENIWKRNFSKTMTSRQSRDFPDRVFREHKSKLTVRLLYMH